VRSDVEIAVSSRSALAARRKVGLVADSRLPIVAVHLVRKGNEWGGLCVFDHIWAKIAILCPNLVVFEIFPRTMHSFLIKCPFRRLVFKL